MKNFYEIIALIGVVIVAIGLAIFIYQGAVWLRTGIWHPYPLAVVIRLSAYWLRSPGDWFGLHRMILWLLTGVPASIVFMVFGSIITLIFSSLSKQYE